MGKNKKRERREQQKHQKKERKKKRTFKEMLPPDWDILAVILLLAFVLRMWFALSYDSTLYDQAGEGVRYVGMVGGEPVDSSSPPLYILFLRICLGIFGRGAAKAAFVTKGILGTISVALIYYIAREISDRTTAVISAAISAIYVNYMMAALALSPRVPGIFILFVVTLILLRANEGWKVNGLAGAILGIGILVDPYLLLFAPGFLLLSRNRKIFIGVLFIVVLPWTLRNSAREGMPLPVYHPSAFELDIKRWMIGSLEKMYQLVDRLYINGSMLFSIGGGWVQSTSSTANENIRNSSSFGAYLYMVIVLGGLVGMLRYHSKKHRLFLYPVLIYLGIMVLFSTTRNTNRLLAEHIAIFYSAFLLMRIIRRFRKVPAPPPE
jgi:hypothetical protein